MTATLDRDPAVPQRDALLDPALVAERLQLLLGIGIHSCRQLRVKYRIGARLRVVHRVRANGTSFDVAASTFPSAERSERAYAQGLERAVAEGPVRPVVHDAELRTVFWTFPNDRKIGDLAALTAPAPELAALLPGWSRSDLVSYAPEKAAAVRCLDGRGRTLGFAKTHAGEEGARTRDVHEALAAQLPADDPFVRLPRALGYSPRFRTLLVEAVGGSPPLESAEPVPGYRTLGRGLARLHGLAPPEGARFRRADPDRLEAAARLIGVVRGDVAESALRLARDLAPRLSADAGECLHGDVNFRNSLLHDGRVALIDLDQVAAGPAAAELGSVLASLRYGGVVGLIRRRAVAELSAAFLDGYAEVCRLPDEGTLRVYTAAALLGERSMRVVTRVRPEGLRRLPELLDEAQRALA